MKFRKYFLSVLILILTISFNGCVTNMQHLSNSQIQSNKNSNNIILHKQNTSLEIKDNKKKSTIAVVFPSKILGKWGIDATNSVMSYLIYKNNNFNIKVFDCVDESKDSINNVFQNINQAKINKVLLLFTYNGASKLSTIPSLNDYDIYLPLIHKNILNLSLDNIVYGAIDYSYQFDKLLKYANHNIVSFYDNSNLGNKLTYILNKKDINIKYKKEINNDNSKYRRFLNKRNKKLKNSTLLINMPIVKSSIILSQINAEDINISKILTTQINYTPLLLSLTQVQDRKNMIIANSIANTNNTIEEYNALLDNDIVYNWVNYSAIIGIQYLINKNIDNFNLIKLENNQIKYPVKLYRTTKFSFKEY